MTQQNRTIVTNSTINPPKNIYYPTSDSSLAAYLHSLGFLIDHADNSDFPSTFFFKTSPELLERVKVYQTGEAIGKISVYQKSYKYVLSLVHHNPSSK
jgi:hypothetical protein